MQASESRWQMVREMVRFTGTPVECAEAVSAKLAGKWRLVWATSPDVLLLSPRPWFLFPLAPTFAEQLQVTATGRVRGDPPGHQSGTGGADARRILPHTPSFFFGLD